LTQPAKKTSPHKLPLVFRLIRGGVRTLGQVAPGLSARIAYRLWFYPRRFETTAREKRWLVDAQPISVSLGDMNLAGYEWGEGPTVLLVHGWDGRGSQMASLVAPLTAAGFKSVALDLPAHGKSDGRKTNMAESAEAVVAIANSVGPIDAVIGHSFGAGVVARAMSLGLKPRKAIMISSPANLRWMADNFYRMMRVSPRVQRMIEERVNQDYGENIWQEVSPDQNLVGSTVPGLIIHDRGDRDVPFNQAERIASAWQTARLIPTDGLGHRRILRDREVIETCVNFLRDRNV